ncbi:hypothetical protein ACFLYB_05340, partial [Chloroflexota bacterium]
MGKGYNAQIRAEVISLRSAGMPWQEIRDSIYNKYQVKPSRRQMQNWFFEYKAGSDDLSGERELLQTIKERFENIMTILEGESVARAM